MGLCVVLAREDGGELETVMDEKNILHKLLLGLDPDRNPFLTSIDWYGDTVFNQLQMKRFLIEWECCAKGAAEPEEQAIMKQIRALAFRCQSEVHLYLKFIGD